MVPVVKARRTIGAVLILGATFPLALRAQIDPVALLHQARTKIVENIQRLPKYTCVQTVRRSRFEALSDVPAARCSHVEEADPAKGRPPLMLAWTDQFKLDVTISSGSEIFSWAGAREFQSADAQEIVGGGLTGTGDFGPFLVGIFGDSTTKCDYLGLEQNQGRAFAVYSYHVPTPASRYQLKLGSRSEDLATLAYEGKFWIDPQSAELSRMTIVVPRPPVQSETCRVETTIDYQRVRIGGSRLLLPQLTMLKLWDADGARYENRIEYAACRAFQSESVFRAEMDPPLDDSTVAQAPPVRDSAAATKPVVIPPGKTLRIALSSAIDAGGAFAGDAIEGQLLQAIRARNGNILVPEGATVHGRIVRVERHVLPSRYLALGLKFHSLSVNGREIPLALQPVPRSRADQILAGPLERRQGIGMFMYRSDRVVLDHGFVSEWKTTAGKPSE
jgi:hypothetical protein